MQSVNTWNRKLCIATICRFPVAEYTRSCSWPGYSTRSKRFCVHKVPLIADADYSNQREFVRWLLNATLDDSHFPDNVLFSYEAYILRVKACTLCTIRICGRQKMRTALPRRTCNTSSLVLTSRQQLLGDHLLGPYIMSERLIGAKYLLYYKTSCRICCREYWTLWDRTYGSCMKVHQNNFRLWCVTTSMLDIWGR